MTPNGAWQRTFETVQANWAQLIPACNLHVKECGLVHLGTLALGQAPVSVPTTKSQGSTGEKLIDLHAKCLASAERMRCLARKVTRLEDCAA